MSLHKKQIDILKRYFYNQEQNTANKYSALILGVENTILTANDVKRKLRLGISSITLTKANQAFENNPLYIVNHNKNVENLKKLGFVII